MKKYGFKLTLPYGIEVDSVEEINGWRFTPNHSQAEPIELSGIFDTREEAEKCANEFEIYKYLLKYISYDSYEDEDEDPRYFFSIDEAEQEICYQLGISPEYPIYVTSIYVEEIEETDKYKFVIYIGEPYTGIVYKDSVEEGIPPFDSYEEAEQAGEEYDSNIDINEEIVDIQEVEIVKREVYEFDDESLNND